MGKPRGCKQREGGGTCLFKGTALNSAVRLQGAYQSAKRKVSAYGTRHAQVTSEAVASPPPPARANQKLPRGGGSSSSSARPRSLLPGQQVSPPEVAGTGGALL